MIPFVGPSYALFNRKASAQRSVNLYLVGMETPSKAQFILQSVPGLTIKTELGSEVRGMFSADRRLFVVAGDTLYEIAAGTFAATNLGTLLTSTGPVDFAWGTTQLVIVDGPYGYVLTLASNAFARITDPDWLGSSRASYLDGYFIFATQSGQQFYLSQIDDASNLDSLDFASAETAPDDIIAHLINHHEIWLFGEQTTEVWFDSDSVDFPLSRNRGALMDIGCIATFSAQRVDNGVMWIGQDKAGSGIVYRAVGYQPQRISTIAVEEALQSSSDLTQAVAYVYQSNGQTFYCINAPGVASTWCFEISTGAWHERCDVDATGAFVAHRATRACFALGEHTVGDAEGNLYVMDPTVNTFNGDTLKRTRISPNDVVPARDRIFYSEFLLDCTAGLAASGISPVATLSWSDDGGMTYGNPVPRSIGTIGNFYNRIQWTRLGYARDRVWRVDFSDDAPFSIIEGVSR